MARTPEDLDPLSDQNEAYPPPPKIGATLIKLRNALLQAKKCRQALEQQNFAKERWMEIVTEVDPKIRMMVRSQILDAVVQHLERVGKPVERGILVRDLSARKVGTAERIRQAVIMGLRAGILTLGPGNRVGLSEWLPR